MQTLTPSQEKYYVFRSAVAAGFLRWLRAAATAGVAAMASRMTRLLQLLPHSFNEFLSSLSWGLRHWQPDAQHQTSTLDPRDDGEERTVTGVPVPAHH